MDIFTQIQCIHLCKTKIMCNQECGNQIRRIDVSNDKNYRNQPYQSRILTPGLYQRLLGMITYYRLINQRVSLPLQLRSLKKNRSVREIEFNLSPRDLQAIIVCYFAFWNRTRITLLFETSGQAFFTSFILYYVIM